MLIGWHQFWVQLLTQMDVVTCHSGPVAKDLGCRSYSCRTVELAIERIYATNPVAASRRS